MAKIGFKVYFITRDRYTIGSVDDDEELVALAFEEDKFVDIGIDIKDYITASITNGIKCTDDEQSTESFLEQRVIEGFQEYNKSTHGFLLRAMSDTNMEDDDLMSAIKRRGPEWDRPEWARPEWDWGWIEIRPIFKTSRTISHHFAPFHTIHICLKEFGTVSITVGVREFNIGDSGTLTHRICCDISSRLVQETTRSTLCPLPEDFFNVLLADVDRKISELELPETLRKQLEATLQWMMWTEILAKPE